MKTYIIIKKNYDFSYKKLKKKLKILSLKHV